MKNISILVLLLLPVLTQAQTALISAGDSSLFQSSGASARVYMPDGSVMNFGGGTIGNRLLFGGNASRNFDGYNLTGGDLVLPFALPTDSYAGYGFLARGFLLKPDDAGISALGRQAPIHGGLLGSLATVVNSVLTHCRVFAGVSSIGYGVPFLQASQANEPLGYLGCKDRLTEHWTLSSQDAFSNRQTALASLAYQYAGLELAGTAGIGSNSPYAAVLGKFENRTRTFSGKVGYSSVQNNFRRILISTPLVSENSGLNYEAAWIPRTGLRLFGSHARVLSPVTNQPSVAATIDTEGVFYQLGRVNFRAANYASKALVVRNSGQDYGSDFRLTDAVTVRGEYLKSKGSEIFIGSVLERVKRFEFTQNVTASTQQGKTQSGFDGGISYRGSQLNWSVEFQEEYFPYSLPGQSPFRRVLTLSFQKAIKDAVIGGQTFVDPNNHMRFTLTGQDYLYGPKPVGASVSTQHHSMGKFIVSGIVRDTNGQPVYGAAIQVDGSVVYSGQDGRFFVRFKRTGTFPVATLTEHFIEGSWRGVSAPATAEAKLEEQADFIVVVVERVSNDR